RRGRPVSALHRRRFLMLSALAAAGSVVACAPAEPRVATKPTEPPAPAAGGPAATTAPAAATAAPKPTTPPLAVAQATSTAAPAAAAATAPKTYKEAPALAQLVKDGKLPPVEKRLPDNPRVLKP